MDGIRPKGRGRAHIFRKRELPQAHSGSGDGVGHGKILQSTENLLQKAPAATERSSSLKNYRLTHNNQRLPSTVLKHNPARKTPSVSECGGDDTEEFPYLPSQALNKFKPKTSGKRMSPQASLVTTPAQYQKDHETHELSTDDGINSTTYKPSEQPSPEPQSTSIALTENTENCFTSAEKNASNPSQISIEETVPTTSESTTDINSELTEEITVDALDEPGCESTPLKPCKSEAGANVSSELKRYLLEGMQEISFGYGDGYLVKIENLPPNTTQSMLEEVIYPYGQPLELELELRISNGEENLSAIVRFGDSSIAGFLASCLHGADTIFAGTLLFHSNVTLDTASP